VSAGLHGEGNAGGCTPKMYNAHMPSRVKTRPVIVAFVPIIFAARV
jgi:hypothetical protein